MQKYIELLRKPMQVKPESLRAARQKSSSTPPHVYRLNYNESPYGLGPLSEETLEKAIKTPYVYPDWFSVELKTNIAKLYDLDFENVVVGPGSSAMINMLGELFINPGDEFIFGDPSYEAFRDVANDYGAVTVPVPLDDDMNYDLDAMLAAVTDKTKILVVVNPNNPTGTFIDSKKLEDFIRKVPKHVITVIDEAYLEFVTDENCYSMLKLIKEGIDKPLVIMKTFSKIYGMAGLRVGYAITDPVMADHFGKSSNAWNVSFIGQKTAAAATLDQEHVSMVKNINAQERDKVTKVLRSLNCKVYDSQTNFILFKAPIDNMEVYAKLEEQDVLIGAPIGMNRVSLGKPEMNEKFIKIMKEILS